MRYIAFIILRFFLDLVMTIFQARRPFISYYTFGVQALENLDQVTSYALYFATDIMKPPPL